MAVEAPNVSGGLRASKTVDMACSTVIFLSSEISDTLADFTLLFAGLSNVSTEQYFSIAHYDYLLS